MTILSPVTYRCCSTKKQMFCAATWREQTDSGNISTTAYGKPSLVEESELKQIVFDTTAKFESAMPAPWKIPLSEQEIAAMLKAIVGFKIAITRVEAKFKLGQNRSHEDREKMLRSLQAASDDESRALARFILAQPEQN